MTLDPGFLPVPACLVQKPRVFAQEARHLRRRGTSLCLDTHMKRLETDMTHKGDSAATALAALADPTRRKLFERLRSGPRAVGELARGTTVSRPAVSQHLAVLKAAGLVRDTAAGTRRLYEIDPQGLGAIRAWLDDMWGAALANFS